MTDHEHALLLARTALVGMRAGSGIAEEEILAACFEKVMEACVLQVESEREECAQIADAAHGLGGGVFACEIAKGIRARGAK